MRRLAALGVVAAFVTAVCGAAQQGHSAQVRAAAVSHEIVFSANRMPSVSGEVYRVDPSGRRVDLSRSPFQDTQPLVSPDGRHVAFFRGTARATAVWVVGIDGRGLRRVSAPFNSEFQSSLAWAPDSRRLALVEGIGPIAVLTLAGARHPIGRLQYPVAPQWSPDGRLVTVYDRRTHTFHASGGVAWTLPGNGGRTIGWSARGLYAEGAAGWIVVHDARGRRLLRFRGGSAAWSPDGNRLASLVGTTLEVRALDGRVVFRAGRVRRGALAWLGRDRVATSGAVFDLRTGKRAASKLDLFAPRSADGSLVATTPRAGKAFALRVSRAAGGGASTYSTVPGCFDDGGPLAGVESLQFAGPSRSLVYASRCVEAFDNVYSVAADGTALRRLTNVQAEEEAPATSPDGSRIALSWAQWTGLSCKGCPYSIRTVRSDGSGPRTLTQPQDAYDLSPTWSPDGAEILFARASPISPGELMIVPAGGGPARDLRLVGSSAAWGPARIAFVDASERLVTAEPDGSGVQVVAERAAAAPAWSPDGRLAYVRNPNVVVVGTGGDAKRLQLPLERIQSLGWSPEGTRFVLVAQAKGQAAADVYTVRTDGTGLRRLTRNVGASSASWR